MSILTELQEAVIIILKTEGAVVFGIQYFIKE